MKKETVVYVYAAVLFVMAYLFTSRLMKNIRAEEFEYFKLGLNLLLLVYIIIKMVTLSKAINNKKENN